MKKKDPIPVLYEDDHLIAIHKPPRTVSVPDPHTSLYGSVLGKVQRRYEATDFKPYLLHRLDKETSGVLLFGKHEKDRAALEAIFRQPDTEKQYLTFLKGAPKGDTLHFVLPARTTEQKVEAHTDFRVLRAVRLFGVPCSLVLATIKTGRKHQIREHFSRIGCPVILDAEHGDPKFNRKFRIALRLGRQFLHAVRLSFKHPFTQKPVSIVAPIPPDLASVLKKVFGKPFLFKIQN